MPEYRLYHFQDGHIRKADVLEVDDDVEAIAQAEHTYAGEPLELWLGARMIKRLEPGDHKSSPEG